MTIYQHFTAEDFIQDEFFRKWVFTPNDDDVEFWLNFLKHNPDKQADVIKARALLISFQQVQNEPSLLQGRRMRNNILNSIEEEQNKKEPVFRSVYTNFASNWTAIAAAICLVGSVWWYTFTHSSRQLPKTYEMQVSQTSVQLVEKANQTNGTQRITLPDGSIVLLSAKGKLSYEKDFSGSQRKVYLSGKGYFEVVKDDTKPFLVFANTVVTQVVGTRFTVNSAQSATGISVSVKSGKVKVFTIEQYQKPETQKAGGTIVLTANQQATYDPAQAQLTKSIVAKPEIVQKPEKFPGFNFNGVAINDVFSTLEQSYGVTIAYNKQTVENCNLTAQLGDEPLFKKLDIICRTIDATYEVWGAKIVVTGKGCSPD